MKIFVFIIFLFTLTHAFSAELPPRWRFEYSYGKVTTHYLEEQPSILFTQANVKQIADYHRFIYQYFLVPPWLDLSLAAEATGVNNIEEPTQKEEQFQYLKATGSLGVLIPLSDWWNTKLVFESFYTTMEVEDDAFGFRNLRGSQIYPEIEWLPFGSDMFISISPYLKLPLWSDIGNRTETTAGLKFVMPFGSPSEMRFPAYAYKTSLVIRIFYTNMHINFNKEGFIESEIDVRQYGATLGINF